MKNQTRHKVELTKQFNRELERGVPMQELIKMIGLKSYRINGEERTKIYYRMGGVEIVETFINDVRIEILIDGEITKESLIFGITH